LEKLDVDIDLEETGNDSEASNRATTFIKVDPTLMQETNKTGTGYTGQTVDQEDGKSPPSPHFKKSG
jgi:hypothetical protein